MNKQMRFEYFNKLQFSSYNQSQDPADFRFGNKIFLKSSGNQFDGDSSSLPSSSDLANLESRFGNNSSILSDNTKFQEAINIADDSKSSSSSEIDCEEIEN